MNNQAKIAELKKNINNKFFPEALKPKLLAQIEKLEAEDKASENKGILPHPKPKQSKNISFEDWLKTKNIEVYKRTYYWVADDGGKDYMYSGTKAAVMKSLREDWQKELSNEGILPHPKPKKPTVARTVKSELKKYYAHREIKTVTVIEDGKKVVYKGEDVLNGAQFLAKGGKVEEMATYYPIRAIVEVTLDNGEKVKPANGYHIKNGAKPIAELGAALATEEIINNSIETNPYHYAEGGETDTIIDLYPLQLVPLSTQLQRITGDSLNTSDYVDENGNEYSTNPNSIIVHKNSGKKFRLPLPIFTYIDGYNLVHNIFQKKITVYETGALVAEIKDGKLDFTNKDQSVVIDRTKVRKQFENGFIPDAANAKNFYKDVEQELLKQYALYEDVEDNKDSEEAKKINKKIQELEGFLHKLERKYAKGGTTEEGVDLFEDYENIPSDVKEVLDTYSQAFEDGDYEGLAKAHEEVNKLGYTFNYYLDGQAYDLRKIGQKGKVESSEEFAEGGLTSGSGDFDYIKFLDYVQPKVAATLLENNVTLMNDYTIVHEGKEYEPVIIYKGIDGKANALSVGYFADNDPQLKLLLSIDFELEEMEYHIRSKGWNINDVDMYAKGGWVKDHKYLNKAEAYEMRYAKGKNRKGYMAKGGEVFDYKNQYDKTKIKSIADVEAFFNYLYYIEKISFHPDDEFLGNMNDDYTKKQAINLDRYMLDCFDVCKKEKKDIYGIAANPMLLKPHLVVGRKAKGVSVKKIAEMHNVTEKYLRKQLQRGQKVELEHTTDEAVAYAIAKDHIYENPDYYILLEKIEMKAKGGELSSDKKAIIEIFKQGQLENESMSDMFDRIYNSINSDTELLELKKDYDSGKISASEFWKNLEKHKNTEFAKGGEVKNYAEFSITVPKAKVYLLEEKNHYDLISFIEKELTKKWFGSGSFSVTDFKVVSPTIATLKIKVPGNREYLLTDEYDYEFTSFLSSKLTKKWFGTGSFDVRTIDKKEKGGEVDNKGILPHPKPKREGSKIFAKAAEIREPGERWQDAVKRANLLLKK